MLEGEFFPNKQQSNVTRNSNTGNSSQITVILIHAQKDIHIHVITSINADFKMGSTLQDNLTRDRNGIFDAVLTPQTSHETSLSSHDIPH